MARFVVTLVIAFVLSCDAAKTTEPYETYNSSDLSYLSNGIQFPVPKTEEADPILEEVAQENLPEMEWMSRLYDQHRWDQYLDVLSNTRCRDDMVVYLAALDNGTSWAAKMHDASGRYSGQFFFGNDYWLGSKTLCYELANPETNAAVPPFPVYFYVAKIRININEKLTPVTRQLNVGECLPSSCSKADVRLLMVQERSQGATINIIGIKAVPGDYNLWQDVKFQIIGGTALGVFMIICIATLVEIFSTNRRKVQDVETQNNNSNHANNNNIEDLKSSKDSVLTRDLEPIKHKNKQGKLYQLLLAFSALNNCNKILKINNISKNSISCIHGLRFCSIIWIILVHTYLEVFAIADNKAMRVITERGFMYQTISNATFSVDTFFFISGLLVTITFFRSAAKLDVNALPQKKTNAWVTSTAKFFYLIVYRFFRLTPAYLFVLGVNELILRYLHNNSVFTPAIIDHLSCEQHWWRNALYINNFFPQKEFCMLWSWYISNDTQFFVVATILLLIAVRGDKHLKCAAAAIGIFLFLSWATTFVIAMKYNYVARVEEPFALFDELYDKPWLRIGPYLVGMITGYFLFKKDCNIHMNIFGVILGWIISLLCLGSLVYGLGREGLVVPASAFYAALGHTAWGIALAWITVACCSGYGGPLNVLFSFKGFLPFSRMTYCAYLIHPVIMVYTSFLLDGPIHLQQSLVIIIYFGNILASFICAFFISLFFEAPVVNMLKVIFGQRSKDD